MHINSEYMYSCSDDKSIRVWNLRTGKSIRTISEAHKHFATCMNYSQKYLILITGSFDFEIKIWEMK